jgi:hypothetical protein
MMIAIPQNTSKLIPTLTWLGGGLLILAALGVGLVPMVKGCIYAMSYPPIKLACSPSETLADYRNGWYEYLVCALAIGIGLFLFITEGRQIRPWRFDVRWLVAVAVLILVVFDRLLGLFFIPGALCLLVAGIADAWVSFRWRRRRRWGIN